MLVEVDLHTSGPLGDEVGAGSEGGETCSRRVSAGSFEGSW